MSLEEHLTRLEAALTGYLQEVPAMRMSRLVAMFDASSAGAAEELASWWGGQPELEVAVIEAPPTNRADLEEMAVKAGATKGTLVLSRSTLGWVVRITGSPFQGADLNIRAWLDLLRQAPQDPRWRYGGRRACHEHLSHTEGACPTCRARCGAPGQIEKSPELWAAWPNTSA